MFETPSSLGWSQASEKQADAHEIQEDRLGAWEPFVVCTQPPLPASAGAGALEHPASGDHPQARRSAQIFQEFWRVALELAQVRLDDR